MTTFNLNTTAFIFGAEFPEVLATFNTRTEAYLALKQAARGLAVSLFLDERQDAFGVEVANIARPTEACDPEELPWRQALFDQTAAWSRRYQFEAEDVPWLPMWRVAAFCEAAFELEAVTGDPAPVILCLAAG